MDNVRNAIKEPIMLIIPALHVKFNTVLRALLPIVVRNVMKGWGLLMGHANNVRKAPTYRTIAVTSAQLRIVSPVLRQMLVMSVWRARLSRMANADNVRADSTWRIINASLVLMIA